MPRNYSDQLRNSVLTDLAHGLLTQQAIADKHSISSKTVRMWAKAAGVRFVRRFPPGPNAFALEKCFQIVADHGWPLSYLSRGIGMDPEVTRKWWDKNYPMTPPPAARTTRQPEPARCDMRLLAKPSDESVGRGRRLSLEERIAIGVMHTTFGMSAARIGAELGRCRQTISRELRRGSTADGVYLPAQAHVDAQQRRVRPKLPKLVANPRLRAAVVELLATPRSGKIPWHSPALVSKRLRAAYPKDPTMHVSAETIYQSLYVQGQGSLRQELKIEKALRSGRTGRIAQSRLRGARPGTRGQSFIGDAVITTRPAEVADRAVPGHWEGDLIIGAGGKSALITLVERTSRYLMVRRLADDHTSRTCTDALVEMIGALPERLRQTLTWDRGVEMARHTEFTVATGCRVFFCDPHAPWQRGSNENINRSIREYFPKGTDFATVTDQEIEDMEYELNTRARMVLDGLTPVEVFTRLVGDHGGALTP